MFDLDKVLQPLVVSVMRDGQTVCVSVYSELPGGEAGEAYYALVVATAMQQAVELSVGLVIDEGGAGEGQ